MDQLPIHANEPIEYTPDSRLAFCQRLGGSWQHLAIALGIQRHHYATFAPGDEPRRILEWIDDQALLYALRDALATIGRDDLVRLLDEGVRPLGHDRGDKSRTHPALRQPPPGRAYRWRPSSWQLVVGILTAVVVGVAAIVLVTTSGSNIGGLPPQTSPTPTPLNTTISATSGPRAEPTWKPLNPYAVNETHPYGVTVTSPTEGQSVPANCAPVSGTSRLPAGKTIVLAVRGIDGPPDQPFAYELVERPEQPAELAHWKGQVALGTTPNQRYQVAVLVSDLSAFLTAKREAEGAGRRLTSDSFVPGLELAGFRQVMQKASSGIC